jgi:UDP-GlcNAc:undecaprenyl-phosphate GlcNAc-1-phosphate transferase
MPSDLRSLAAFALAGIVVSLVTPLAIKVAIRTGWFDVPSGYKGHVAPTPYLGGAAIIAGLIVASALVGGSFRAEWPLLAFAVALFVLGTIDDRVNLGVGLRVAAEVAVAVGLWALKDGWSVFHPEILNLPLTVIWVVGLVNAFNLMDNMDGAAATTAAFSAAGAGVLALISGGPTVAPLCFAVAGACVGFLRYNLARPARIFMGDGGSLPLGFLVAALTMAVIRGSYSYLGPTGVIVGGLLVGLVILDTSLVTLSRTRGRRPVFSGGRDHLTHRVVERLGSSRAVAAGLAVSQFVICVIAIAAARAGVGWVLLAGATVVILGVVLIWGFERGTKSLSSAPSGPAEVAEPAELAASQPLQPERTFSRGEPQPERAVA